MGKKKIPYEEFVEILKKLPIRARTLYIDVVRLCKNGNGYCHATDSYFCRYYGISRQTLWRSLKILCDAGLLEKGCVKNTDNHVVRTLTPVYTLSSRQEDGDLYERIDISAYERCEHTSTVNDRTNERKNISSYENVNLPTEKNTQSAEIKRDEKSRSDVSKLQRCSPANVSKLQQRRFKIATNNVSKLRQQRFKIATHNNIKDNMKDNIQDNKSVRGRTMTCVDLLDEQGNSIVLPNPYNEKEDGYHG